MMLKDLEWQKYPGNPSYYKVARVPLPDAVLLVYLELDTTRFGFWKKPGNADSLIPLASTDEWLGAPKCVVEAQCLLHSLTSNPGR